MQICKTKAEIGTLLSSYLDNNKSIGFVPTMGALHKGHLSLVNQSVSENELTVVSIFVNPTQFNNPNDLKNYPRDLDYDLDLLEKEGCQIVFTPDSEEMYPEKDLRQFDFGGIESRMEGEHRPGHFNGVAQIVSKLFEVVPADKAYFGLKDFQQLAIIKSLVKQLVIPIEIIPCDTVREIDGLAMSSRNTLLLPEYREAASIINKTLIEVMERANSTSINSIKKYVTSIFLESIFKLEYFDIVDDSTLQSIQSLTENSSAIACIAVWAGEVRLIDNIQINS